MAWQFCPNGHAAAFSRCGRYRWWLNRRWRQDAPTLLFIGLNPSSADGRRDDATLRRLIGFADGWGYGGVEVVNLFAWISADPAALRQSAEPKGRRTDAWIRRRVGRLLQQQLPASSTSTGLAGSTLTSAGALPEEGARRADRGGGRPDTPLPLPLWLGWGNGGRWRGRDRQVLQLLSRLPVRLLCLGHTASGQPRHPLYVPGSRALEPFAPSWEQASAPPAAPCPASRAATRST